MSISLGLFPVEAQAPSQIIRFRLLDLHNSDHEINHSRSRASTEQRVLKPRIEHRERRVPLLGIVFSILLVLRPRQWSLHSHFIMIDTDRRRRARKESASSILVAWSKSLSIKSTIATPFSTSFQIAKRLGKLGAPIHAMSEFTKKRRDAK